MENSLNKLCYHSFYLAIKNKDIEACSIIIESLKSHYDEKLFDELDNLWWDEDPELYERAIIYLSELGYDNNRIRTHSDFSDSSNE